MLKSKGLWILALGLLLLHIALAASLPLVEDETYYQLWASHPAAGYYDHPPMVAWSIAAGQWLFGPSNLAVRAGSILAIFLLNLVTFRIAWILSRDQATAFRASLWGASTMPLAGVGFAATPDPFSALFWTAATWALVEVLKRGHRNWWLLAGLFAGLGVLSKFTGFFFGLALVIWLITSRKGRRWLTVWQVWAGAVIGILVLLPFLYWNYQHDWVGFQRQFGRIGETAAFSPTGFMLFCLSFVVYLGPLLFWFTLRGMASPRVPRVLIWLIAPLGLYLIYHATKAAAGGQWLVPIFPTLAVIAALGADRTRSSQWVAPAGFGLTALVMLIGFWPGKVLIGGHNPFTQVRGWATVSDDIRAEVRESGAVWIATDAYGLTGQLHHYLGAEIPVWSVTAPERYLFRKPFPRDLCQLPALFISRSEFVGGVPYFTSATPLPALDRREGGKILMRYHTARVSGLKACPP